jgi:hypothetical protein
MSHGLNALEARGLKNSRIQEFKNSRIQELEAADFGLVKILSVYAMQVSISPLCGIVASDKTSRGVEISR